MTKSTIAKPTREDKLLEAVKKTYAWLWKRPSPTEETAVEYYDSEEFAVYTACLEALTPDTSMADRLLDAERILANVRYEGDWTEASVERYERKYGSVKHLAT